MHSSIINGEGLLKGQPANPGSPGKWLLKLRACEEFHFVSSMSDINCLVTVSYDSTIFLWYNFSRMHLFFCVI